MDNPERIYLVGMPAAGKTTFGQQLAYKLNYPFIDLDWEIEQKAGMDIPAIFQQYGEDHFRLLEKEIIREVSPKPAVIATGGGAPCFHKNMDWIRQLGFTIFLDVLPEELATRAWKKAGSRPLLNQSSIEELTKALHHKRVERLPFYHQAHCYLNAHEISSFFQGNNWKQTFKKQL